MNSVTCTHACPCGHTFTHQSPPACESQKWCPLCALRGVGERMTEARLAEIETREKEATPGPWKECGADDHGCKCGMVWAQDRDSGPVFTPGDGSDRYAADGLFVAHARQDVPDLIREVRASWAALAAEKQARAEAEAERDRSYKAVRALDYARKLDASEQARAAAEAKAARFAALLCANHAGLLDSGFGYSGCMLCVNGDAALRVEAAEAKAGEMERALVAFNAPPTFQGIVHDAVKAATAYPVLVKHALAMEERAIAAESRAEAAGREAEEARRELEKVKAGLGA